MSVNFGVHANIEYKNYGDYRAIVLRVSLLPLFGLEANWSTRARFFKFMPYGDMGKARYFYL